MPQSFVAGIGMYVPKNIYTNQDLEKYMETSDEWIQERTGIKERRYAERLGETTATMGIEAAKKAIERARITPQDIDFIVFATLTPDYYFPGPGVMLQKELGLRTIGALDIRNQCSGFVYALSVADQYIKTGMYRNILIVGSELQSLGLDMTTRGRGEGEIGGSVIEKAGENSARPEILPNMGEGKVTKVNSIILAPRVQDQQCRNHGDENAQEEDADFFDGEERKLVGFEDGFAGEEVGKCGDGELECGTVRETAQAEL